MQTPKRLEFQSPVRVSYLISTRNRVDWLKKALDNARQYVTPEDELIVADGGSTDGTVQLLEANPDIVTSYVSAPDRGEAHGFNRAILCSRGRIIKPVTDDDYFDPKVMRQCLDYMQAHPEVDVLLAGGTTYAVDPDGKQTFEWQHCLPPGVSFRDRLKTPSAFFMCGLGFFFRRDALALIGLFDTKTKYIDVAHFVKILGSGANFRYMNACLYHHRLWPQSGCFGKDTDPRHKRERAAWYLEIGDWDSLAACAIDDVVAALNLPKDSADVKLAVRQFLANCRPHAGGADKLKARAAQMLDATFGVAGRIKRAYFSRSSETSSQNGGIHEQQLAESRKEDRVWDGTVW